MITPFITNPDWSLATLNPEGVPEISPGLRRDAGRYPGIPSPQIISNPEGVAELSAISERCVTNAPLPCPIYEQRFSKTL